MRALSFSVSALSVKFLLESVHSEDLVSITHGEGVRAELQRAVVVERLRIDSSNGDLSGFLLELLVAGGVVQLLAVRLADAEVLLALEALVAYLHCLVFRRRTGSPLKHGDAEGVLELVRTDGLVGDGYPAAMTVSHLVLAVVEPH